MNYWYFASFSSCVVIKDDSMVKAMLRAQLHPILEGKDIVTARRATDEDVALHFELSKKAEKVSVGRIQIGGKFRSQGESGIYTRVRMEFMDENYFYGLAYGEYLQRFHKDQLVLPVV